LFAFLVGTCLAPIPSSNDRECDYALAFTGCKHGLTSKSGPGYDKRFIFSISSLNFLQEINHKNICLALTLFKCGNFGSSH